MEVLLHGYEVNRPTWFYLSTLLVLAVYYRFNRLWSLRNLDLTLLLAGSPGLIFVGAEDLTTRQFGHIWLFSVTGLWLVRLFLDPIVVRRPYLGQNLNLQGLGFLCFASFAFLMTQAITEALPASSMATVTRARGLMGIEDTLPVIPQQTATAGQTPDTPPASPLSNENLTASSPAGPSPTGKPDSQTNALTNSGKPPAVESKVQPGPPNDDDFEEPVAAGPAAPVFAAVVTFLFEGLGAKILAIFAHAAVISGLWFVGRNLFGDAGHGLAMATLYLLLPCTAYNVGEFNHVLPSALIVWALVCFRKPVISGVLLGLACGTMLFPVVLLPLWLVFYGRQRALRFGTALLGVAVVLFGSLLYLTGDTELLLREALAPVNLASLDVTSQETAQGLWRTAGTLYFYRLPLMVAYLIMLVCMTIWPKQRSLETLLSQSAIAILGIQLWYTDRGGVYLLWYLPLILIVAFRPRLAHMVLTSQSQSAEDQVSSPIRDGLTTRPGVSASQRLQLFR